MPIIIDANRCCDFGNPLQSHAAEIIDRIKSRKIRVTVGGQLLRELITTPVRRLLVEWGRLGVLDRIDSSQVDILADKVKSLNIRSDDPHVLALALCSGTRLLFTDDQALIADFKDVNILRPKGKVVRPKTRLKTVRDMLAKHGS